MKAPTLESSLKLIQAVDGLLKRLELQPENITEETDQSIDSVLDAAAQVQRECKFPDRTDIIQFLAKRFAEADREGLVKRIVAIVGTLPNEDLYGSYEEICERRTPVTERKKMGPPAKDQDAGKQGNAPASGAQAE